MRWNASNEDVLEGTGDGWRTAAMIEGFLGRTPALTLGEQAELFGAFVLGETAAPSRAPASRPAPPRPAPAPASRPSGGGAATRPSGGAAPRPSGGGASPRPTGGGAAPTRPGTPLASTTRPASGAPTNRPTAGGNPAARSSGPNWGQIFNTGTNILGAVGQGAQMISQFATMFGGNNRTAQDFARIAGQIGQGTGQAASMLQSIGGGQVPPLPGPTPAPAGPTNEPAPAPSQSSAPPPAPTEPPAASPEPGPAPAAPSAAPTPPTPAAPTQPAGQFNATALLGLLLSNPQLQQALRAAPVLGQAAPRSVQLALPPGGNNPNVTIPLGAVLNAIGALTSRSIAELNEATAESDEEIPSYLLGESDEFVVDPGEADARAAVVLQYFRAAAEGARFAGTGESSLDESDEWLQEAGFEL